MKENNDHKDNTGMVIAIIIAILLVVGLIAYFAMNGNNDVKDAIDDTKDTIENATDNDQKTAADVAGSYQASINNDNGEDVAEDNEDFVELVLNEDGTAKLYNSSESKKTITGSFTITDTKITIVNDNTNATNNSDNAATNDNSNNETTGNNNGNNGNDNAATTDNISNQTYEFTINDDDTLTYTTGENNVTLAKVDHDSLRYIK